ncbi:hypothetical protein BBP40_002324 [Aspergillus hancockii]|nr:hypothetical protein BBP40_002324 [Aspergillus hancockii]
MEPFTTTPRAAESSGPQPELAKYRASCDRCQNIKVRCSKDKPKRCVRKGIICIYSPMRRTGSGRAINRVPTETSLDDHSEPQGMALSTPGSSSAPAIPQVPALYPGLWSRL